MLQRLITAYLARKLALQGQLQKQISSLPAGATPADTVRAFRTAQLDRISELTRENDDIRDALTKFMANAKPEVGPTLEKILRAFDVPAVKS